MRSAPIDDIGRAVEVVNSWDTLNPEPEQIPDLDMLRRFLRWIGRSDLGALVGPEDLARFRDLRAQLRTAFDAPELAAALAALNGVLAAAPVRLQATQVSEADAGAPNGTGTLQWQYDSPTGDPIGTLAPTCAAALIGALDTLGLGRFGICSGAPCTCVFVDRTRNHRRRFCSDQCNDRVAQGAYRRRVAAS